MGQGSMTGEEGDSCWCCLIILMGDCLVYYVFEVKF